MRMYSLPPSKATISGITLAQKGEHAEFGRELFLCQTLLADSSGAFVEIMKLDADKDGR